MRNKKVEIGKLDILVLDGDRGKNYPHQDELYESGHCLFLSANNVTNSGFRFSSTVFITKEKDEVLRGGKLQRNDIVLTTRGTVGNVCLYDESVPYENIRINSGMLIIRCGVTLNSRYIYYVLRSFDFQQQIKAIQTGSAQPQLPKSHFLKMVINIPSKEAQDKIGEILSMFDRKIKYNNKINDNLLEQALCLFNSMIAPLKRNGCIGNYCKIKSGFAFKSSWWTDAGVKVIKISSINQDCLNLHDCSYVNPDKFDKASDFQVTAGDLLIAMTGATIGKFAMVPYYEEPLLVNQRVGKFFLGDEPLRRLPFIYCTLKQPEVFSEVVNRGQGSAQPNISAADIMSISCAVPNDSVINSFNSTTQPLFDIIISNQRENRKLSILRDTLLPKLMSGELDVSELNI